MMNSEQIQFARMAAAIEYLYDHAHEQPSLAAVAAQVHVSAPHLQRQFQAWAGVSPKKMLQHISIKQAKQVLKRRGRRGFRAVGACMICLCTSRG